MKTACNPDTPTGSQAAVQNGFWGIWASIISELRRGARLAGEKYQFGMLPPL